MLSTKVIKSGAQATQYFFKTDDYYTKESGLDEKPSIWYGKGAEKLELQGEVSKEQFKELLSGKLPNGIQVGQKKNGEISHRAGFDLTFSAPKSWSIAHYLNKDPIFGEIMEQAVKNTLDLIEKDCAMAYRYEKGIGHMSKTGNLVASLHFHRLSRELEPQDHVHAVIMNATERYDGMWRALKSDDPNKKQHENSEGFIERVRACKKDYGAIYRAEHARLAIEKNFAVEFTKDGFWELKHISKEMIKDSSTRRQQIVSHMEDNNTSGGKAAAAATLITRAQKAKLTKEEISEALDAKYAKYNIKTDIESFKNNNSIIPLSNSGIKKSKDNLLAIKYAIAHLSEHIGIFTESKLLSVAMKHHSNKANIGSCLQAIKSAKDEGYINLFKNENGEAVYISQEQINLEKNLISNYKESIDNSQCPIITSDNKFNKLCAKHANFLTKEQKDSLAKVLRSNNNINAIDGRIGSGKTHLIPTIAKFTKKAWYSPIVLTLSQKEVENIQDKASGITCKTVSGYLKDIEIRKNIANKETLNLKNQVLIVDSAQRLSARQQQSLTKVAANEKLKIIYLFDSKQPESMAPGNSMKLLNDIGLNTGRITQSIRQLNPIDINIKQEKDDAIRFDSIVNDYLGYIKDNPNKDIKIITQDKTLKNILNTKIQEKLAQDKSMNSFNLETLSPQFLTKAQYTIANQYKKGHLISFNKNYVSLDIKKGEYYKIDNIDKKHNIIKLSKNNEIIYWNPDKVGGRVEGAVRIYQPKNSKFNEGDKVYINDSNKSLSISKGKEFVIKFIDDKKVTFIDVNKNNQISIKNGDVLLKHIDLSYAKTASDAYNDTPDIILTEQCANKRQTNLKQFYKALGQCKEKINIYTDDKILHAKTLEKYKGDSKPIVNELLKQIKQNNKGHIKDNKITKNPIDSMLSKIETAEQISLKKDVQLANITKAISNNISNKALAYSLTKYCINQLSEKEAVFTDYELKNLISKESVNLSKPLTIKEIEKSINKTVNKKQLYTCSLYKNTSYTTPNSVKLESSVLNLAKNTINKGFDFTNLDTLNNHLNLWQKENTKLTDSQIKAIKTIAITKNSLTLVNGLAGVGKTTMLSAIKPLCDENKVKMIGIAPTNSAANEVKDKGIESYTVDSFLNKLAKAHKDKAFDKNEKVLLVLDESSMASTKKLNSILTLTKDANYRLAFIGDVNQLASIEQGKMFHFLQKAGVETTFVNDIIRQKDSPKYLGYVKELYKGNYSYVINKMQKDNCVFTNNEILKQNTHLNKDDIAGLAYARCDFLADTLIAKDLDTRINTRVVTPANKDRKLFNALYREKLQGIGEISQKEFKADILVDARLNSSEKSYSHNFDIGQVMKFNSNFTDNDIKKGDYLTIKDIDYAKNYLNLKNSKGKSIAFNLSTLKSDNAWKATIYNTEVRNIAVGDNIRWSNTDKKQDRVNMDEVSVIDINQKEAIVKDKDGNTKTLEYTKDNSKHWDYAYSGTAYTEQGKTAKHVAILMTSNQAKLASKPTFLVAITRAMQDGTLVTDDTAELAKRLEVNSGIKTSSLEAFKSNKELKSGSFKNIAINLQSKESKNNHAKLINKKAYSKKSNYFKHNVNDISKALSHDVKNVATHILGDPKKQDGLSYFFGSNKGSLAVTVSGDYQGTWHDFDTGEKGNLLKLIQTKLGLGFKDALEYAAKLVNHIPVQAIQAKIQKIEKIKDDEKLMLTDEQKQKVKFAQKLASEAKDIKGTIAEKYLKETRGIKLNSFTGDLKYHHSIYSKLNKSKNPALLVVARDKDNNIQAVQAIYLDFNGKKADVNVQKQSFGVLKGAVFSAKEDKYKSQTAVVCEGPEDALSILKTDISKDVFACLGKSNFNNIPKNTFQKYPNIVFALDNDGKQIKAMPGILNAAKRLDDNNKNILLTQPSTEKQDYNSILKLGITGEERIRSIINKAEILKDVSNDFNIKKNQINSHSLSKSIKMQSNPIKIDNQVKESFKNKVSINNQNKQIDKEMI